MKIENSRFKLKIIFNMIAVLTIFDQMNAALVSIRESFETFFKSYWLSVV